MIGNPSGTPPTEGTLETIDNMQLYTLLYEIDALEA